MISRMCLLFLIVAFISTLLIFEVNASADIWGYGSKSGPTEWCAQFPNSSCCGHMQSPVALSHSSATEISLPPLHFIDYDHHVGGTLNDNGHTVVIIPDTNRAKISGSHLNDTYTLASFHFHWGDNDAIGSEHSIDGVDYPVEVHFVHYNEKYNNFATAANKSDGLVVIAVFLDRSKINSRLLENEAFEPIIETIKHDVFENDVVILKHKIQLQHLLPKDRTTYFTYKGSLTTPPCSEVVTWILFDNIVTVTESQIENFRQHIHSATKDQVIKDNNPDLLEDNFRPTQSTFNRVVNYVTQS